MAAAQELGGQKRSRTNTNSTASSGSEDEPSFKKDKIELAESESEINKVAILDAGAQYGKVSQFFPPAPFSTVPGTAACFVVFVVCI